MSTLLCFLRREDGVAAIEFCLVLPMLLLMTVGAYDVSRLIAARMDYQQALSEAAGLAMAQPPQDTNDTLINAVAAAASVPATSVTVTRETRCNNVPVTTAACPNPSDERSRFFSITVRGSFRPMWTHFAIKTTVPITINRTIRYQ